MQIPQLSAMALSLKDRPQFNSLNLGGNRCENEGCKYLSQSKWIHLKGNGIVCNRLIWVSC